MIFRQNRDSTRQDGCLRRLPDSRRRNRADKAINANRISPFLSPEMKRKEEAEQRQIKLRAPVSRLHGDADLRPTRPGFVHELQTPQSL